MLFASDRVRRGPWRVRWSALAFLFVPALAVAQTGTIAGTVVDGDFGGGLPSASILVVEAGTGASADIDGNYRIQRLPVGSYTLRFSFVGYATQVVNNVEVADGQTTTINVTLTTDAQLEEVVVEAAEIIEANSQIGLDRLRARASQVSDAISAETISRSGASDAGDAMERVTGASVQGGQYVYVRGLGDRYANTQLNGATLPTADPDRQAVQFDLFPSGLLENIVTLKTFTPDQQGNFSGGLINISTRSFPAAFTVSLSASGGGNTQTQLSGDFLASPDGGAPLTGFSDGRGVPSALEARDVEIPSTTDVRFDPAAASSLQSMSRSFGTAFAPVQGTAPVNQSYSGSIGNRIELFGNPLGFIIGGNWGRSASYYGDGTTARFSGLGTDVSPFAPNFVARDQRGSEEVSWGGIGNVTYQVGGNNEISLNTLFTRSAESEARFLEGDAPQIGSFLQQRTQQYTERQVGSGQLRGRHLLESLAGLEVEWRGSYSETRLNQPDLRFFNNTIDTLFAGQDNERIRFGVTGSSIPDPLRYFRDLDESLAEGALDVTVPLRRLGIAGEIKVGGLYNRTDRGFAERLFQYDVRVAPGDALGGSSPDSVAAFFDRNLGAFDTRELADGRTRVNFTGTTISDRTDAANQYDGSLDVAAGYGMVEVPLLRNLRVIAGARVETTDLRIEGAGVTFEQDRIQGEIDNATGASRDSLVAVRDGFGQIDQLDVLPALNLVYSLSESMNLRAAATRTLARPTFREIAPFAARDFGLGELLSGNPTLDRTLITNYDLRWEWFVRPGDILAVSGYYKYLDSPIERAIINANGQTSYRNVDEAEIFGAEIEARTALGPYLSALEGLSLGANLTLTQSTISRSAEEIERGADADRPLQGQSPYLLNLDLAYENPARGTAAGLYFNVFGRRLSRVSAVGTPDVFEESAPTLDLVASQRFLSDWSLKLSAKNLLDSPFLEVYDIEGATLPAGLEEPVFQRYDRGLSFSVGISYSPRFGGGQTPGIPTPSESTPVGL